MATELPSIVDVAEKAGVSVATASRVMSSSTYPVSEATRQKVLKAAAELNYEPNSLARSLKAQRSRLIAVIVGDNSDPYFAQVARGVEEVANENGYLTIVCNTDRNATRELSYLQTLQDYRADGIVFAGSSLTEPAYIEQIEILVQKITKRGGAVITLSPHILKVPSIQADSLSGARNVVNYLLKLGHKRIAFVTGPENVAVANLRRQGYEEALKAAGLPLDPALIISGNFTQAGGEKAAQTIAQMSPAQRPTAVFTANDETAIGLIVEFQRQKIMIPRDISVCGFGDIPMTQVMVPSVTTVRIGLRELGRIGAHRLLAMLNKETVPELELYAPEIMERETTAPPPPEQK